MDRVFMIDAIAAELVQAGREAIINVMVVELV